MNIVQATFVGAKPNVNAMCTLDLLIIVRFTALKTTFTNTADRFNACKSRRRHQNFTIIGIAIDY